MVCLRKAKVAEIPSVRPTSSSRRSNWRDWDLDHNISATHKISDSTHHFVSKIALLLDIRSVTEVEKALKSEYFDQSILVFRTQELSNDALDALYNILLSSIISTPSNENAIEKTAGHRQLLEHVAFVSNKSVLDMVESDVRSHWPSKCAFISLK
jgi:hypothetical protein